MQKLSADSCRSMAWKNGGGVTTELAIFPQGATLDNFDWRISSARIERPGRFSAFPGIDRSLALLSGAELVLHRDDGKCTTLRPDSAPFAFAGESQIMSALPAGAVTDVNVMTRRARYCHQLERLALHGSHLLIRRSGITLLYLAGGAQLGCRSGHRARRLALHDALLLGPDDPAEWTLQADAAAILFIISIMEKPHA